MRRLRTQIALALGLYLLPIPSAQAEDVLDCTVQDKTLICNVTINEFINSTSSLMTNGWENQIDIIFALIDNDDDVIKSSKLHASQRCYIDPFESPCLVLWRGAKTWKTYRDDKAFLRSISSLTVHAMKFQELVADNYRVRMTITVKSGSERETESVKQIFKQTGNDLRLGDSSLVGSFISAYTPNQTSAKLYTAVLETPQFYIDLDFTGFPENSDTSTDQQTDPYEDNKMTSPDPNKSTASEPNTTTASEPNKSTASDHNQSFNYDPFRQNRSTNPDKSDRFSPYVNPPKPSPAPADHTK